MRSFTQDYVLRDYDFDTGRMRMVSFNGRRVADASSREIEHSHSPDRKAQRGERCSACRWLEVRIYIANDESSGTAYVLETVGRSLVDGEHDRFRTRRFRDPWLVIAKLAKRHDDTTFLPLVAQRALSEAAEYDGRLAELLDTLELDSHEVRYTDDSERGVDVVEPEVEDEDRYNLIDPARHPSAHVYGG
jgi:hypothetical protein